MFVVVFEHKRALLPHNHHFAYTSAQARRAKFSQLHASISIFPYLLCLWPCSNTNARCCLTTRTHVVRRLQAARWRNRLATTVLELTSKPIHVLDSCARPAIFADQARVRVCERMMYKSFARALTVPHAGGVVNPATHPGQVMSGIPAPSPCR